MAFPKGSNIAPISSSTESGSLTTFLEGTETNSAKAPSLLTPKFTVSGSRCNFPALAFLLVQPTICDSAETLSPNAKSLTSSPISTTSPMNS